MGESTRTTVTSSLSPLDIERRKMLSKMNKDFFDGKLTDDQSRLRSRLEKIVLTSIKSPQQLIFYKAKLDLEKLKMIERNRPLTFSEKTRRNDTLEDLWGQIRLFGLNEAQKRMRKYRLDGDAYADVQQALSEIFFERLPYYDPLWTAPTTYFAPYFNQVITDYVLSSSQHLSQYDAKNVGIVRKAIYYFDSLGVKWDESMISERTGLSAKVVKQTIQIAFNSIRANVDDMGPGLAGKISGPEDQVLDSERRITLGRAIENTLTCDEINLLFLRMNFDGRKEISYQAVADAMGISVREIKKRWSTIIAKLNTNAELDPYRRVPLDGSSTKLDLHSDAGETAERQFLEFLNEFDNLA